MNRKQNNDIRSIRIFLIFSIFLISTGLTVIASAENEIPSVPNKFYGNVAYNGDWSQTGTVIEAYIDDELHSEEFNVQDGQYFIYVTGSNSDEGKKIIFKLNGEITDNTAIWHASTILISQELDLIIGDIPSSPHPASSPTTDGSNSGSGSISPAVTSSEIPVTENVSENDTSVAQIPTATSMAEEDLTTDDESNPGFGIIFTSACIIIIVFLIGRKRQ